MYDAKKVLVPFLTSLAFSGSFIAAKYTTADLSPLVTTLLRYIIAVLFFAVLIAVKRVPVFVVTRSHLLRLLIAGLLGILGYHYFFFASLHYTSVANTAIINGLSPTITGILAAAFIAERLSRLNWLGIAIAFGGVLLLICQGDLSIIAQFEFNRGDLLMLVAVVCWAAYALIVKSMLQRYSPLAVTFLSSLVAVAAMLLLVVFVDLPGQLRTVSPASVLALLYMGLVASGIGYLLYNMSIGQIGPTRTSGVVYSTVPVLTATLALFFFAEPFTVPMLVSIVLVAGGLYLALKTRVSRKTSNQESTTPD